LIFEEEIITKVNTMLAEIKAKLETQSKINSVLVIKDIKTEYEKLIVDLVSPILFGKSVNFEKLHSTILKGVLFNIRNTTMFNIITMLPIWHFLPNSLFNKIINNTRSMHNFVKDLVDEYKNEWNERLNNNEDIENYKPNDLINSMLFERYKDKTCKTLCDDDDIIVSVSTIFNSFFDSVTSSLSWITYYVAKNPQTQIHCREEIESVLGQSQPSLIHKQSFKYVNACTKETFRLANLVPVVLHVASNDCVIGDHFIAKGTPVVTKTLFIVN
jgi:cytochrome P450